MPSMKPERRKDSKWPILGSERVDFLLFVHSSTYPQLEIADVLRDFTQLHLHLGILLRPSVQPDSVLIQLPPEPYVGTDNRSSFTYEIDRGRSCHTLLRDEVRADDRGASANAHDTMDLRSGT